MEAKLQKKCPDLDPEAVAAHVKNWSSMSKAAKKKFKQRGGFDCSLLLEDTKKKLERKILSEGVHCKD